MRRSVILAIVIAVVVASPFAGARSYKYDDAGRLVLAVYDDGNAIRYEYTHGNNISSVVRTTAPVAPSALTVVRATTTEATLSWQDNSADEAGFSVQRRSVSSGEWQTVASLEADSEVFYDTGLLAGRNYVYRVFAIASDEDLQSAYSDSVAASSEDSIAFDITSIDLYDQDRLLFLIIFQGQSGRNYQLEMSDSLKPDSWTPYSWRATPDGALSEASIPGVDGPVSIYVLDSRESAIYFRILQQIAE